MSAKIQLVLRCLTSYPTPTPPTPTTHLAQFVLLNLPGVFASAVVTLAPADAPFTELASINPEINPGDDNFPVFDEETFITGLPPFSVCKNDCPGGKGCVVYFYI